jgi:hypothetical protein
MSPEARLKQEATSIVPWGQTCLYLLYLLHILFKWQTWRGEASGLCEHKSDCEISVLFSFVYSKLENPLLAVKFQTVPTTGAKKVAQRLLNYYFVHDGNGYSCKCLDCKYTEYGTLLKQILLCHSIRMLEVLCLQAHTSYNKSGNTNKLLKNTRFTATLSAHFLSSLASWLPNFKWYNKKGYLFVDIAI